MTASSKKDTDLFIISREQLQEIRDGCYHEIFNVLDEVERHPFTEELVWMTPEEEEKRIRQAAINGVLDRAIEKFGEWYDAGFARPVTKEHVTKILEMLRQQQAPGTGGQG